MKFTSSFRLPSSSSLRPLSSQASVSFGLGASAAATEPPSVVALRKRLVLAALERPVRFRTDLDVLLIVHFLASLDALAGVALPALHYLATEATLLSLKDGDVLCYQEDRVTDDSSAFVIIDGSLCGYFNKAFSQRPSVSESFQVWNARQAKRHGVLIDFGEFQTTYSNGALCGFDDLLQGGRATQRARAPLEQLYRRKGIHAQEHTRAVAVRMDTLERLRQRFALSCDRGVLHARDTSQSDLAYLGMCAQLSEFAKTKLLQTAPRRRLGAREGLFVAPDDSPTGDATALVVVLTGRLEVFWDGDDDDEIVSECLSSEDSTGTGDLDGDDASSDITPAAAAAAARARQDELTRLRKTPLATIRRGQTFGDQTLGLALDSVYSGAQLATTSAAIRVAAGDALTEVIWISKALYDEHLREDRVSLSYHPISSAAASALRFTGAFRDWAPTFFSSKHALERDPSDLSELVRRMLADAELSKFAFQFPPLVLERVCQAMELRHFSADALLLSHGEELTHVLVVVHGALRVLAPVAASTAAAAGIVSRTESTRSVARSASMHAGAVVHRSPAAKPKAPVSAATSTLEQFVPGDVFGATELAAHALTSAHNVYVQAETLLLTIPRIAFDRWLAPLAVDTIFNAGSAFQRLETLEQSSIGGRLVHADKRSKASVSLVTRRQSVAHTDLLTGTTLEQDSAALSPAPPTAATLDATARLLKKMGVLPLVPRFVLRELLAHASVVRKDAGDVLFHEGEESAYLVVLLTGFLSFYSLEHMSTTIEMFQKHSFCSFSSFQGSQSNPEDYVADAVAADDGSGTAVRTATIAKHRAAMHGVHIQTLHAGNAFRTGVLRDGTICPATVVAQTRCECLVFDESAYTHVLQTHGAVIDVSVFDLSAMAPWEAASSTASGLADRLAELDDAADTSDVFALGSLRSILAQRTPLTLHPALAKCFEHMSVPWLTQSPLQMQQLVRSMRCISVKPGERLIRCDDVLEHLLIVLSGRLSLYVQQNEDVSTFLDASQRSVRSLMLERSVTSNYSTTSQQLYKEARGSGAGARGRVASSQDAFAKRKLIRNKITRISGAGLFLDSVLAAVHEERLQRSSVVAVDPSDGAQSSGGGAPAADAIGATAALGAGESGPRSRSPSRVSPGLLLHSAAAKARIQQKIDSQRTAALGHDAAGGSLFLCHLGPGEVFGEDVLAPHGVFRSLHDVFVDSGASAPLSSTTVPSSSALAPREPPSASSNTQLLLLDRRAFHAIAAKSDDEIEKELRVRSRLAKLKWHKAERKLARKRSHATGAGGASGGSGDSAKPSKLFDLFKNILNQRCVLTMRTIADTPVLRDVSDASKRELCLAARFEALERGMNAYRENGALHSGPRYYLLLNGRIGLCAKSVSSTFASSSSSHSSSSGHSVASAASALGSSSSGAGASAGAENCLREVLPGTGFGEFEILVPECPRCVAAIALEPCRLLTFPAAAFLKHWPHVSAMKSDIAYLRTRVPYFARLELERIAYLYTTLSFQSFTRGSNVFEQGQAIASHSASNAGELYLLKEGACSIRQRVVVHMPQGDSSSAAGATKGVSKAALAPRGSRRTEKPTVRVMVTVADVADGHLFWLDASTFPFTLQVVSASLTITNLAIDKLRAILPRTQCAALEQSGRELKALYLEQFNRASRAVVTLLNEQHAAQMGKLAHPTFLPMLTTPAPLKVVPSASVPATSTMRNGGAATRNQSASSTAETAIPFSRLLMARPVDLVALQAQEAQDTATATWQAQHGQTTTELASASDPRDTMRSGLSAVDAAYREEHSAEYYALEPGLPNSTLVGSFPDDIALRRRSDRPRARALSELSSLPSSSDARHQDATVAPEFDTPLRQDASAPAATATVHANESPALRDSSSHVHLEVKVPAFPDLTRIRVPTPPSTSRPSSRSGLAAALASSPLTPRPARCTPAYQAVESFSASHDDCEDDNGVCDLEIDMRELLRAEMADAQAPMRTLKLTPSLSKANALGQYLVLATSPRAPFASSRPERDANLQEPDASIRAAAPVAPSLSAVATQGAPRSLMARVKAAATKRLSGASAVTPVVPFNTPMSPNLQQQHVAALSTHALVRKQGFLGVTVIPSADSAPERAPLRSRKRRYVTVVDNVLVEYAETVDVSALAAGPRSNNSAVLPLQTYCLDARGAGSSVEDAPVASSASEVDKATLRLSLVLTVDATQQLLLTAASASDKATWLRALEHACALGPAAAPLHQALRPAPTSDALVTPPGTVATADTRSSTPRTSPSRQHGRSSGLQSRGDACDTVLHVDYRIR